MKLISMTDFVFQEHDKYGELPYKELEKEYEYALTLISKFRNYAEFLKQPLTLGMFVPCDKDGNIMEEPVNYNIWEELHYNNGENNGTIGFEDHLKYQEAKDRVLFEGFEFVKQLLDDNDGNPYFRLTFGSHLRNIRFNKTIEEMINFDHENLVLTESANKQLGL